MRTLTATVAAYWHHVQTTLFPYLEHAGLTLTPELAHLVTVLDVVRVEEGLARPSTPPVGAPPKDRRPLARAFLAMHVLNQTDRHAFRARLLSDPALRRVCGWATPEGVPRDRKSVV